MKKSINPKEALAWIVLVCAAFLFSITIAFAQDKSKSSTGKISIKIIKKEDGKTTKIDTTINSNDNAALEKILKDAGGKEHMSFNFSFPEAPEPPGSHFRKHSDKKMTEQEREEFKEAMKNLDEEMKDLHEKIKDIHIEIESEKDEEEGRAYSYHFEMPPMPPVPPMFDKDDDFFSDHDCKGKISFRSFFHDDMDSLEDDDHVIIIGDKNETAPVFEREITGKHGEKVFVYKRSKPEVSKDDLQSKDEDVKLYPNPSQGKFTLSFNVDKKSELRIRIYNNVGKEVYTETLKDFNGYYFNQVDLSGKGKGNYILKITYGEKTITEKFVIE